MRKLVSNFFVTADGVVESPEKWSLEYWNDDIEAVVSAGLSTSDALLMGRTVYEEFKGAFAENSDDPVAGHMNQVAKYVASTTMQTADWSGTTVLDGDVVEAVRALKEQEGKDIAMSGSATLVRTLLAAGLVDEIHLLVYPVVRGTGARLFPEGTAPVTFAAASARSFDNGVQHVVYRKDRAV